MFIPRIIGMISLTALLWNEAGCGVGERNPKEGQMAGRTVSRDLPFTSILNAQDVAGLLSEGSPASAEMGVPRLAWIGSRKGLQASGLDQAQGLKFPAGEPDFGKHDVVLLTIGVQGTTGYGMKLRKAEADGAKVRFFVDVKSPGPNTGVGEALTQPGELILIAKLPDNAEAILVSDGKETRCELERFP